MAASEALAGLAEMGAAAVAVFFIGLIVGAILAWLPMRFVLKAERRWRAEQQELLLQAEGQLREAFQAMSAEALRNNNQSFLDLARTSLGEFRKDATNDLETRQKAIGVLVKPINESLEKMGTRLKEIEKERHGHYSELVTQLKSVSTAHEKLQVETANLVKALRAPSVRGRWGEIQLKRVVEMAGMLEHCDFIEQESVTTEGGKLRPDLTVRLPGGQQVVVDAKTPLEAYLKAVEATDDESREHRMREHARQVRDHMTALGNKSYWEQFDATPEFVVMFLPGEMFFSAALQVDPGLIEFGVERRVIVASPTTLISLLRAVAYGWRQEQLARNAQEISALGRTLYDRIVTMSDHFASVGKGLDRAVRAYNDTVGSLEGRVLVAARRFTDLGILTSTRGGTPEPIDQATRQLQAPELDSNANGASEERSEAAQPTSSP